MFEPNEGDDIDLQIQMDYWEVAYVRKHENKSSYYVLEITIMLEYYWMPVFLVLRNYKVSSVLSM